MGGARSLQLLAGCTQHSLEGILVVFSHNIDYTAEKAERTEERGVTEKEGAGPPGAGTRVPCASGEGRLGGVLSAISAEGKVALGQGRRSGTEQV